MIVANSIAGLTAEMVAAFVYVPSDVLSQRLQVQNRIDFIPLHLRQTSAWAMSKTIWRTEGIRGYFRGYFPYLLVYGPGSAVWWSTYEVFKRAIHFGIQSGERAVNNSPIYQGKGQDKQSFNLPLKKEINHFVSGALAGCCSVMVTNPLDVARTRLQLLEFRNERDKRQLKMGFGNLLMDVYRREGFRGLYKGVKPRIYVNIPGSALAFVGYEYLKEKSQIK